MTITRDLFISYLNCKYKAYLELQGHTQSGNAYSSLRARQDSEYEAFATEHLASLIASTPRRRKTSSAYRDLKRGMPMLFAPTLNHGDYSFQFNALQRVRGKSSLGAFSYTPILFVSTGHLHIQHRLLLAFGASVLGSVQGSVPSTGLIVHGNPCKRTSVKLDPYGRKVTRILTDLAAVSEADSSPRPTLNRYCKYCHFERHCRKLAIADDDLSLLDRVKEKDIIRYKHKGIFTVTQLSYTFRPRKRQQASKGDNPPVQFAFAGIGDTRSHGVRSQQAATSCRHGGCLCRYGRRPIG